MLALNEIVQILTLVTLVVGIGGVIWRSGGVSKKQEIKLEELDSRQTNILATLAEDIGDLKAEIKELSKVTIKLVEHTGRMDRQDDRITGLSKRFDERVADADRRFGEITLRFGEMTSTINMLKRGEGFVFPFKSKYEVSRDDT